MEEEVRIEYMSLSELAEWPRNPKTHDVPELKRSLQRFGFVAPIVLDETTHRIVAGHGRLIALQALCDAGEPPPLRVRQEGDRWFAPVLRGAKFATVKEAEAYLIADNYLTEVGGWDPEALADMASGMILEGTGLDADALESMLSDSIKTMGDFDFVKLSPGGKNVPWGDSVKGDKGGDCTYIKVGRFRFKVSIDEYEAWEESIRQSSGFDRNSILEEIRRRLKL